MTEADRCPELAVVVGAGAFGEQIIRRLADAGLGVVAISRTRSALDALTASIDNVIPCATDISADASIEAIKAVLDRPVRIAVHGPGVAVAGGILTAPTDAMADSVNIKVGGMMRLTRAVDEWLVKHSRLVAIGGHYGLEPTAYAAAAGVANAALVNAVRQLSLAYGPRGITAHVIAPGPADTDRLRRVAQAKADMRGVSLQSVMDELKSESSIGAFTTPEQVAWAVSTLLAKDADAMTGSTVMLDSGRRHGLP